MRNWVLSPLRFHTCSVCMVQIVTVCLFHVVMLTVFLSEHQSLSGPDRRQHDSLHHQENLWPVRHHQSQRSDQAAGPQCPLWTGDCLYSPYRASKRKRKKSSYWSSTREEISIQMNDSPIFISWSDWHVSWEKYMTCTCCDPLLCVARRPCGYCRTTSRVTSSKSGRWSGTGSGLWRDDRDSSAPRALP